MSSALFDVFVEYATNASLFHELYVLFDHPQVLFEPLDLLLPFEGVTFGFDDPVFFWLLEEHLLLLVFVRFEEVNLSFFNFGTDCIPTSACGRTHDVSLVLEEQVFLVTLWLDLDAV